MILKRRILTWAAIAFIIPTIAYSKITQGPYITEPEQTSMTIM